MLIIPTILNGLAYCIIDKFIKSKEKHTPPVAPFIGGMGMAFEAKDDKDKSYDGDAEEIEEEKKEEETPTEKTPLL